MVNNNWTDQKEITPWLFGIKILLFIRKYFGRAIFNFCLTFVVFFIWLGAFKARRFSKNYLKVLNEYCTKHKLPKTHFSSFKHILFFALTLADRLDVLLGYSVKVKLKPSPSLDLFQKLLSQKKGIILLFSHIGNPYILPVLKNIFHSDNNKHIYMDQNQNPIFHDFLLANKTFEDIMFHSIQNMDIKVGIDIIGFLEKGDIILIAADRVKDTLEKHVYKMSILDQTCYLPKLPFKMATTSGYDTFYISALKRKSGYDIKFEHLPFDSKSSLQTRYCKLCERDALDSPINWFNWFDFFQL